MDDFFSILDRAKKDVEEKQRQAKRAEEAAARQQAAASASARVAVVAANAASRFDARERGRVLESAKALRTEGAGSIILKPASEQEMKASSAAGAKLSAALQRAAGLSGRLLTLLSVLEHAHTIGVPGAAHACMPTALMASALAQGVPLSEVAVAAVEDDLSTVDEDGGMALRQRLVSDVEAKLPADASMAAAWLAQVPEEVRPGIQHLLESLRRAGESLRGDPVAAAAASLRKGKGQLPDTYLDPADAVAAVAARHRELGRLPILFVYGATDMEGGGLAAQLVAPESTLARVRSDQQQGAATVFGPGEAVVVYLGCGHASAVSMGGSTLEVQYLADTVEATQYMDAFSNCVVRLPDHLAALAADLEAAQTVPAWAAVAAGGSGSGSNSFGLQVRNGAAGRPTSCSERPGVQLALGLVTPPRPAPAALPAAQRSPTPGSDRRLASIAAPAGRTSPRHEAARGLTAAAVQAVEASGRGRVPAALSAVVDAMGFTEVAYRSKRAHPSGTAPGGHDNSQKVPAPAGNAAVSPIAKKARTTDEVLFDGENPFSVLDPDEDMPGAMDCDTASGGGVRMRRGGGGSGAGVGGSVGRLASPAPGTATASSPAISINSSADVETDGSGDEDIEDQMPTDIYQKLQGRLSNVAVDPATAVTLCGTKRRAAYWNEQRLEAVRGGREAIAYHAIDHNYSTNTVRQCVKQDLVELGPDDDVYEDVEPDAADDGDDVTHWKHLFGQVVASPWLELCVGAEVIACANLGNGVVNGCKGKVEGFTMAVTTAAGRQRYFDQLDPRTDLPFGMTKDEAREKYPQVQEHLRWPIVSWTKEDGSPLEAAPVLPYSFSVQDITCGDVFATRLQLPLLAGYALTIHKSQGQTIPQACVEIHRTFAYGQIYTALSRVRRFADLRLLTGLKAQCRLAHPDVVKFETDTAFTEIYNGPGAV